MRRIGVLLVASVLAMPALASCNHTDEVTVDQVSLETSLGEVFSTVQGSGSERLYILPSGVTGRITVGFETDERYPTCTLALVGQQELPVESSPGSGRTRWHVTTPYVQLVASSRMPASLTCRLEAFGGQPRTDKFTVQARPAPMLRMNPPKIDFGTVAIGASSRPVTVSMLNVGSAPALIDGLVFDRSSYRLQGDACTAKRVTPGNSCAISVVFAPKDKYVTPGTTLQAHLGDGALFQPPALQITAVIQMARGVLTVEPSRVDFGQVQVGASAQKELTITNTGDGPLFIAADTLFDPGTTPDSDLHYTVSWWFGVVADACYRQTVAPKASCRVVFEMKPTEPGDIDVKFRIYYDDELPGSDPAAQARKFATVDVHGFGTLPQGGDPGQPHG